jgi:hypothetical protein
MPPESPPKPHLAACILACAAARNGHGRRWAQQRCAQALAGAGRAPSALDAACAAAARRVGEALARVLQGCSA